MANQLISNSAQDFLVPTELASPASQRPTGAELPVFGLGSLAPLALPSEPEIRPPTPVPPSPTAAGPSPAGKLWLQGDVLMCGCPDCGAPMSIRLWLLVADCWNCGTSIELSEEQEREARRLVRQREADRDAPSPGMAASGAAIPTSAGANSSPPAAAAASSQQIGRETEKQRPGPEAKSLVKDAGSREAAAATRGRMPTSAQAGSSPEVRRRVADPSQRRRPTSRRRAPTGWLIDLLRDIPAWLISLIFHLILLTVLALLTIPGANDEKYIVLNATVSRELRRPGQEDIAHPADVVRFDLPLPEQADLEDRKRRESLVRADQEARELRLVDTSDPLPKLQEVKQRIGNTDGSSSALVARDPRVRVEMIRQEGGTTLTEAAVARGLRWLARQQQPDGRWRLDSGTQSDAAATSLALLPFLGAGQTHLAGRYKSEVAGGLRWLVQRQAANGDLRVGSSTNAGMYAHGQAAIVLCEAFLMTGDEQLRDPAQRAIDFIVQAQYPDGGWRYKPRDEASPQERRSDTSVVGWQLMALQSARSAGLHAPEESFELCSHFLDSVQSHDGARYAYQPRNGPTHVMTAEALLCRIYLGWNRQDPPLVEGMGWLGNEHSPDSSPTNVYYWYYATQAFHHIGGEEWQRWNVAMRDVLVNSQQKSGREAGSWEPRGEHASAGGRVYMTSLAVCTLEVYYRHLPIFRQIDLD